jgi:excisionase family DNA binding protein
MARQKQVYTTGEIAKICNVAPRTVSKWFDSGKLRGYRIPGSRDRRVPVDQLISFMRAHNMPLDGLESGVARVLIVDRDNDLRSLLSQTLQQDAGYEVREASNLFEAGVQTATFRPTILLIDLDLPGFSSREVLRTLRDATGLTGMKVIVASGPLPANDRETLLDYGVVGCLTKPFEVSQVVRMIEEAVKRIRNGH